MYRTFFLRAVRFEDEAKQMMAAGEYGPLLEYERLGPDAVLSVPTPDHYLPLLYVLGTRQGNEATAFPIEGVDGGSISMLAVRVGEPRRAGGPEVNTGGAHVET
jgi:4,5-DOPA dioxygenase extradiol